MVVQTGMHIMGGFTNSGSLSKICKYLGILDSLKLHHINSECMDEIRYEKTKEIFKIPSGKEAFIAKLTEYFPHEKQGIRDYVQCLYALTEEVPLFYLKEEPQGIVTHSEKFSWAADRLISHFISDVKLQALLAYLNPLYGGVRGHSPAYIHALINVLYINGSTRFIDGSQQLANALRDVICSTGGAVISNAEVAKINVEAKSVTFVETTKGEQFRADWYVAAVHPTELQRLLTPGAFQKGFVKRLEEIPLSYSAFSLFIDLKPGVFPYIDHTCYYVEDYCNMWDQAQFDNDNWPKGFMYMTPPDDNQGKWANRLLVHCIMSYEQVRRWENTYVGHRGEGYDQWKQMCVSKVMDKIEHVFPKIRDHISEIYASSPLTIRDYYHTKEGAIFGNRKDCDNLMLSQLAVYTKIKNLFMTGQNINLHGICGVPLTAVNTSEAILGLNTILKQVNDAN